MEKKTINHYLLTRFNVRMDTMLTIQLDKKDITKDTNYLEERFRLFFKYTVPSVLNQTDLEFSWIILLSDNTPRQFKNRLKILEKEHNNIICLYIRDDEDYYEVLNSYFQNSRSDWYITSRVDNDDALCKDYIKTVKQYLLSQTMEICVLSFNNGLQYSEQDGYLCKYSFPSNHFTSMLSPYSINVDTIISHGHMDIGQLYKINNIDNDEPMWLEVVHETNITNRMHFHAKDLIENDQLIKQFNVDIKLKHINNKKMTEIGQKFKNTIRLFRQYGISKTFMKISSKIKKKINNT